MSGVLQSERREEIEALLARTDGPSIDSLRFKDQIRAALRGSRFAGYKTRDIPIGRDGIRLTAQLRALLDSGAITLQEANAYFGGQFSFDGLFASLPTTRSQQAANATEVELVEQGQTQADVARIVSSEAQGTQESQGTGGVQPVTIELAQFPDQYRIDSVSAVIRDGFDQVEQHLASIRAGRVAFAPNSIDGSALRSGSIRSVKLDPLDVSQRIQQWPTDLEAIEVEIDHDTGVDRWQAAGSLAFSGSGARPVRGPGRVWRARELRFPPSYRRPTGGPMRYRIVRPGLELGVMSIVRLDSTGTHSGNASAVYQIRYGIVIRGIRYFGDRPPTSLLLAGVGAHPASANATTLSVSNLLGTAQLFSPAARTAFASRGSALLEPFAKLSSARMSPSSSDLDACVGFEVGLVTGETWRDTYGQLNGCRSSFGGLTGGPRPVWAMNGHRDPSQVGRLEAPAPAVVVTGTATTPMDSTWAGGTLDFDEEMIVTGVPFSPEDCGFLAPSTETRTFSLVIEAALQRYISGDTLRSWFGSPTRDMRAGAWWTSGVRIAPAGQRRTLIDVVVY
jgi:hypothetical protein